VSKPIEDRRKKLLAMRKKYSKGGWSKAFDLIAEVADLGEKKKHRAEAVETLKAVVEHGPYADLALSRLSYLVGIEDADYMRSHLDDEDRSIVHSSMAALIRLLGREVYSEAVEMILDPKWGGNFRVSVLTDLSDHSRYPFEEMVGDYDYPDDITDEHLPLEQLRAWRDAGFPDYVEPKIEIPKKQLKKAGVTLPDDYVEFLLKHHGRDRLEFDDCAWSMLTAAQLFEPRNVNGEEYPAIGMLKGYVAGMPEDFFPDGETTDAKNKPYPLDRLAAGLTIAESEDGDVLYLDPSDGNSTWIYRHDGGDVEKVGKTFKAWKRKARKAWD
jgi:hypothetical protein